MALPLGECRTARADQAHGRLAFDVARQWIIEHGHGFVEGRAVLCEIRRSLGSMGTALLP
jgi:hypothetical protein